MDLSEEHKQFLADLIKNGVYQDENAAIDDAVHLLRQRSQLRDEVRAGIHQADQGELLPAEEVLARLQRRAKQIEQSARSR